METPQFSTIFLILLLASNVSAWKQKDTYEEEEQTTGVFYDWHSTDGCNLFTPVEGLTTYLIDNEGKEVHTWDEPDGLQSRGPAYITEAGTLLLGVRTPSDFFDTIQHGGAIREYNKEGECIWEFRTPPASIDSSEPLGCSRTATS